jgi:hypothetical protein
MKKDPMDLLVEQQLRDEDRAKHQHADAELAARMDQHAKRARRRMFDEAKTKNKLYDPTIDKPIFTKREILKHADCLPHEWQALTDAFDRMEDVGLGNNGRGWWLGPPGDRTTRIGHQLRVGKGVIVRAGKKIEIADEAGHAAVVRRGLAAAYGVLARGLPGALDALGEPMNAEVAQRLIEPPKGASDG